MNERGGGEEEKKREETAKASYMQSQLVTGASTKGRGLKRTGLTGRRSVLPIFPSMCKDERAPRVRN